MSAVTPRRGSPPRATPAAPVAWSRRQRAARLCGAGRQSAGECQRDDEREVGQAARHAGDRDRHDPSLLRRARRRRSGPFRASPSGSRRRPCRRTVGSSPARRGARSWSSSARAQLLDTGAARVRRPRRLGLLHRRSGAQPGRARHRLGSSWAGRGELLDLFEDEQHPLERGAATLQLGPYEGRWYRLRRPGQRLASEPAVSPPLLARPCDPGR